MASQRKQALTKHAEDVKQLRDSVKTGMSDAEVAAAHRMADGIVSQLEQSAADADKSDK